MSRIDSSEEPMSTEPLAVQHREKNGHWGFLRHLISTKQKSRQIRLAGHGQSEINENNEDRAAPHSEEHSLRKEDGSSATGPKKASESANPSRSRKQINLGRASFATFFNRSRVKSMEKISGTLYPPEQSHSSPEPEYPSLDQNRQVETVGPDETRRHQLNRFTQVRRSDANKTMIFKGETPPCSPLSNESRLSKTRATSQEDCRTDDGNDGSRRFQLEEEPRQADNPAPMRPMSKTLHSFRHKILDHNEEIQRTDSSPTSLRLLRGLRRRASSFPVHGESQKTSRAHSHVFDYDPSAGDGGESPWGIKESPQTAVATEHQTLSRSFKMPDFVNGLKGKNQNDSGSDSLSPSDDESDEGGTNLQEVDMLQDAFVDYSVKQINKDKASASKRFVH